MTDFEFKTEYEILQGDLLTLKICEKNPGGGLALPFYYYDIYENEKGCQVRKISIRIGENYHSYYNGNIGYEIDEPYRGHHYSCHAVNMVLPVARAHGMDSIYLTCRESNIASRKIIERTGARLLEIADVPRDYCYWKEGMEKSCIYQLLLV